MSYMSLPMSFWGYTLETTQYILNMVPSKVISATLKKLWIGQKPSLGNVQIWVGPANVLKRHLIKLETWSDVCLFVGYPKGTKGYLFYDSKE